MHTLIVGRTFSGKSALAKRVGSRLRLRGVEVLAFNPTKEKGYTLKDEFGCAAAEWETEDRDEFMREVVRRIKEKPGKRVLIIDEAHTFFSRLEGTEYNWLATRGRHFGISVIAITQKATLINPTLRGQCATVFLFQCSLTDAKFIADEYGNSDFKKCSDLPRGQYLEISASGDVKKGVIFQ